MIRLNFEEKVAWEGGFLGGLTQSRKDTRITVQNHYIQMSGRLELGTARITNYQLPITDLNAPTVHDHFRPGVFSRYSIGALPVQRLNARENALTSL